MEPTVTDGPQPANFWDQLPGEEDAWFQKFLVYKDLGPTRTLAQAHKKITGQDKKGSHGSTGTWRQQSAKWQWVARAEAYDVWIAKRVSESKTSMLMQIDTHQQRAIHALTKELADILEDPDPGTRRKRLNAYKPILSALVGKGKASEFLVTARKVLFGQKITLETDPLDKPMSEFKDYDA